MNDDFLEHLQSWQAQTSKNYDLEIERLVDVDAARRHRLLLKILLFYVVFFLVPVTVFIWRTWV